MAFSAYACAPSGGGRVGLTWNLAALRGLGELMYDMIDQPDLIHEVMRILHDGALSVLESLERRDLLSPNHDGAYVGSGGFGWSDELPQPDYAGKVRLCDMWGFAESQETVGISPEMFEEFVFPYQSSLLDHFGLNCYGCCEPLDKRWHIVERLPRLRRVSVSPWANRAFMAEMLGNRYLYSMKPNPADLAMPEFDEEGIRAHAARRLARDARLPGGSDHEGQPYHRSRSPTRGALGADRQGRSGRVVTRQEERQYALRAKRRHRTRSLHRHNGRRRTVRLIAGHAPLEFVLGAGEIVPGFEAAVLGMSPGDSKIVTFPPEQGYGPYVDELAMVVERSQLPSDLEPALGQQLQLRRGSRC